MADYTMEVRELVNLGYHFALDSYPIFDESYRPRLNEKILSHYWYYEIGQETPDRFNHYLRTRMGEIMPYYNQLYMSELIKFDPLASDYYEGGSAETRVHEAVQDMFGNTANNTTSTDTTTTSTDSSSTSNSNTDTTGNETGTYGKNGSRTRETIGKRTEDLSEHITSDSTTTNNLKTTTHSDTEDEANQRHNSNKTTNFSDVPQAGVTTTTTVAPDGTVTTETTGYLTTQTQENLSETTNNNSTSTTDTEGTNTGTVEVDGTSDRTNDNTIDTTETAKELWKEYGNDGRNTTGNQKQDTTTASLEKFDSVNNTNVNFGEIRNQKTSASEQTGTKTKDYKKGRTGFSPATLIKEYRETLLNIDLLIIKELENLFMEVF